MKTANIKNTTGNVIVEFDETKGTFLTPRGRYTIELYDRFLRMRGNKYDYKIKYDDISRLFLLPKPDDVHTAFVISLDKPIRQGQQRYQHLVLQTTKETSEVTVNLDKEVLQKEYKGDLQPVMHGSLSNLVAKTFKVICRKKVFIPGKFANANQQACVKCALRANEGLLYPLEKQFIFIHKPPVLIRFDEVESVEFQRYAGGQGSTRNFDLCVTLKNDDKKEYVFSGIDRSDYTGLYNFLSTKKIRIKNLENIGAEETGPQAPVYNEDEIYGVGGDDLDEGSEDEDYDEAQEEQVSGSSDDDMDSDDMGSEVDEDLDSDIEDARKAAKKAKKRPSQEDDNESPTPKKKQKKSSPSPKKRGKKKKDPNAPKRALTSYILYGNAVRAQLKAENPDFSFGELNKRIAADYKNLSAEERKQWDNKAAKEKERYQEEMAAYSAPEDDSSDDDAPKKKKKKDPDAPKKALSAYNFFMNENRARMKEKNPDISFGDLVSLLVSSVPSLLLPP
jgi:structure-specific recognition protein 1